MPESTAPVELDFESWIRLGVEAGWVTPQFCLTHDGIPLTVAEEAGAEGDDDDFFDACRFALRVTIGLEGDLAPFYARWGNDKLSTTEPLPDAIAGAVRTV